MNYASIRKYDTSNWDGINTTIFFSGCKFKCPGCFNSEAQDFNYGKVFDKDAEDLFISYAKDPHSRGVCILGGEVFQQPLHRIKHLLVRLKYDVKKPIHVWTGYKFEDLLDDPIKSELLFFIDTLVDGQFEQSKKDLSLKFRGSSNQRVIDVQKSLKLGKIILIK